MPDLIMTTVRLPKELHEQLRQLAFERRVSMHQLLLEGARQRVAQTTDVPVTVSAVVSAQAMGAA